MSYQKSTQSILTNPKFTSVTVDETMAISGAITITDATESTSVTTGSIITSGGIGAAKSLYVGEDITVVDDLTVGGNAAVTGTLEVIDVVTVQDTTNSTTKDTGCLVLEGGLGVEQDANFGPAAGGASIPSVSIVTNDNDKALTLGGSTSGTAELLIMKNTDNTVSSGIAIEAKHNDVDFSRIKMSEVVTAGVGTEDGRMKFQVVAAGTLDTFLELKGDTDAIEVSKDMIVNGSGTIEATSLKNSSGNVSVSASAAPQTGQFLIASSTTTATWQDIQFPHATVTQITSITTGVIINSSSGVITTVSASTTAGTAEATAFTVTNSAVVAGSAVVASVAGYSGTINTNGVPGVIITDISVGSFDVTIVNTHSTNALSGTLDISFIVV